MADLTLQWVRLLLLLIAVTQSLAAPPLLVVIDTGIDSSHPVFASAFGDWKAGKALPHPLDGAAAGGWIGWDFVDNDPHPRDHDGHGTHVAGVAWKQISPSTFNHPPRLVMLRVGNARLQLPLVTQALESTVHLRESGCRVAAVLCAFTFQPTDFPAGQVRQFREALKRLLSANILVIAAAGADGVDLDRIAPRKRPEIAGGQRNGVVVVASCSADGHLVARSNWGRESVTLAMPGVRVTGPAVENSTYTSSGTSASAARFAGWYLQQAVAEGHPVTIPLMRQLSAEIKLHPSLVGRCKTGGWIPLKNTVGD